MARSEYGVCCICGANGKLSFEHLPPHAAFNDNAILLAKTEVLRSGGHPDNYEEGARKQQKGSGKYTLCEQCNNSTGNWYAPSYVDFAKQGMELLMAVQSVKEFYVPFRAVHSTRDKAIQEQIYRGEWEQVKVAKAEEARLEKARLERERFEAVRLEQERLERERLQRCREQERLAESERQRIASLDAENRRISRLRRENLIVKLRNICLYGGPGLVFALLVCLELNFQWFPTYDRWVQDSLILLAFIAFGFSLIAIESQLKNPIPRLKIPRWQLDELANHRHLRRKTDPTKNVWTRTFERVAMTEFPHHSARVAVGMDGKFAFFVYSKNSGGIACTWYSYDTEQKAMHAAVDFMREGKEPATTPRPQIGSPPPK